MAVPTVQASSARKVLDAAARRGVDSRALAVEAGIDLASVDDPEARVPYRALVRLYGAAARATGDPCFGLHVGEGSHPRMFDALGAMALRSPTLREAFAGVTRSYRVLQEGARLALDEHRGAARVRYVVSDPSAGDPRHEVEATLAIVKRWLEVALGRDVPLAEVAFAHAAPAELREHRRVFGVAARFSAADNRLAFDAALLDLPLAAADPSLTPLLERLLAAMLARLPRGDGFVPQVRARIAAELRRGPPQAAALARGLGVSPRTLQRRLAEEGRSLREVTDEVRRELALGYVRDSGAPLAEIAAALGYASAAAFHRAFRRWTGSTPRRARRS
jgi:AraC-like DNA-binding protein